MRSVIAVALLLMPVVAFAQARAPHIKRTNPPTLSKPTGYTHVVEVSGPVKTIYIAGQVAADKDGNIVGAFVGAAFGGGPGRYSNNTLLTTAIGRPACA